MSKIAAGRAGWSANTFSEGGFGGQGLPDAQFTSTPALSITLELLYTTDSGWGEFSWGEGGWGHDEKLTRTRSNWELRLQQGIFLQTSKRPMQFNLPLLVLIYWVKDNYKPLYPLGLP